MRLSSATIANLTQNSGIARDTYFQLCKIPLLSAGCPEPLSIAASNRSMHMPLVIARNVKRYGFIQSTNYYPKAVVVAGAQRRAELLKQCVMTDWGWVDSNAADALNISASDAVSSSELFQKIGTQVTERVMGIKQNQITASWDKPWIAELYPFERFCVFNFRGKAFRQGFELDPASRGVVLAGPVMKDEIGACIQKMPVAQTGLRYAFAPPDGNSQTSTQGAKNSELVTMTVRNWTNINEAVSMYLDAIKHGLYHPMRPAFAPVRLAPDGKMSTQLAAQAVHPPDFVVWSEKAYASKAKNHGPRAVPRDQHAYVGKRNDPSTWYLPLLNESDIRAAAKVVRTFVQIPASKREEAVMKIEVEAARKGIRVTV